MVPQTSGYKMKALGYTGPTLKGQVSYFDKIERENNVVCDAVHSGINLPTLRRNLLSPSRRWGRRVLFCFVLNVLRGD